MRISIASIGVDEVLDKGKGVLKILKSDGVFTKWSPIENYCVKTDHDFKYFDLKFYIEFERVLYGILY